MGSATLLIFMTALVFSSGLELPVIASQASVPISGLIGGIAKILANVVEALNYIIAYLGVGIEGILASVFGLIGEILQTLVDTLLKTVSNIVGGVLGDIPLLGKIFTELDTKSNECVAEVKTELFEETAGTALLCVTDGLNKVISNLRDILGNVVEVLNSITILLNDLKDKSLGDGMFGLLDGVAVQIKLLLKILVDLVKFIGTAISENGDGVMCLIQVVVKLVVQLLSEIFGYLGCLLG
ncbi:uncharacterized protein LOC123009800 [Tribolium madens]|uniref:uncharacterized protein LOC123009800 n=1 Tax=Tribolium madens TaxID=41895 RepID=UPI001CF74C7F|nr:uncharacterized protein LOC123009800 [Tribolium madens]